jgi:hypothetical protein
VCQALSVLSHGLRRVQADDDGNRRQIALEGSYWLNRELDATVISNIHGRRGTDKYAFGSFPE